jgi:excisionase family DNA binding protein
METYVTAQQVARMLRVGVPTERRYIRSGELPASGVGRSRVVSSDDIDRRGRSRTWDRSAKCAGSWDCPIGLPEYADLPASYLEPARSAT